MANQKTIPKVAFSPYFPFGFCSRLATNIEGMNGFAGIAISIVPPGEYEDTDEFQKAALAHYKAKMRDSKLLCDRKYAKDVRRKCGTPSEERAFRFITKEGLDELLLPPENCTLDMLLGKPQDGNKKEITNFGVFPPFTKLRSLLPLLAASSNEEDYKYFSDLLFKAVNSGFVTPLSAALPIISNVQMGTQKYSQNQVYNTWRLSHIYAMFRENQHLTNLDRRPGCASLYIDGIYDDDSYNKYLAVNGLTVSAMTYYALSHWYAENPGYYTYTQTEPDTSKEAKLEWLSKPAFYDAASISHIIDKEKHLQDQTIMGNQRVLYSVAIGLATGRKSNYICYHGKPGPFKWLPKREAITQSEYAAVVHQMKTDFPEMTCPNSVNYGLYFCSSRHQFEAIFERTRKRHQEKKPANFLTDKPYVSLHAIPVNDSGTFLLWCLMETSPIETEKRMCNFLVQMNIGFEHSVNAYYPLNYKGRRVFPGYTMDITKINRVLVDYLNGDKFYICCYPEQAVYYRQLFPDLTFL